MSTAHPRTQEQRIADLDRAHATHTPRPSQGGHAARRAIINATTLAVLVRDESTDTIGPYLDQLDTDGLYALAVTLAAMVDPDVDVVEDRLAWLEPIGRQIERQTSAAAKRAARRNPPARATHQTDPEKAA